MTDDNNTCDSIAVGAQIALFTMYISVGRMSTAQWIDHIWSRVRRAMYHWLIGRAECCGILRHTAAHCCDVRHRNQCERSL